MYNDTLFAHFFVVKKSYHMLLLLFSGLKILTLKAPDKIAADDILIFSSPEPKATGELIV